jgi:hypothetical protein
MMAMVLHEKGRSALRRREYGEALMFLLEADSEFKYVWPNIVNLAFIPKHEFWALECLMSCKCSCVAVNFTIQCFFISCAAN